MLRIWGRTSSSNVQKLLWFCEETNIPYERIDAGLHFGVTRTPAYLSMNPTGLIPTIDDEGFVLWESNTILRYLASKHQCADWYPQDLRQRAEVEKWMDWASTSLAAAVTPVMWQMFRTPPEQQDHALMRASAEKATQAMRILDGHFSRQLWAAGSHISLADIPMAIQAYRWLVMPWERIGWQRPSLANAEAWFGRLAARPVFQQTVMLDLN